MAFPVLEDAAYLAGGLMPTEASAAGAFIVAVCGEARRAESDDGFFFAIHDGFFSTAESDDDQEDEPKPAPCEPKLAFEKKFKGASWADISTEGEFAVVFPELLPRA